MSGSQKAGKGTASQLGGKPEGRVQQYFCIDDDQCRAFARVSKEAEVIRRVAKTIQVQGKEVKGWIVEVMVPATDGVVRVNPVSEAGKG